MTTPPIPEVEAWRAACVFGWQRHPEKVVQAGDDLAHRLERCEAALREIAANPFIVTETGEEIVGPLNEHVRIARDALARPEGASS